MKMWKNSNNIICTHRHILAGFSEKFTSSTFFSLLCLPTAMAAEKFSSPQNTELGKMSRIENLLFLVFADESQTLDFFFVRSNSITRFCVTIFLIYVPPKTKHNSQEVNAWRAYLFGAISHVFQRRRRIHKFSALSLSLSPIFNDINEMTDNISKLCALTLIQCKNTAKHDWSTFLAFSINAPWW